MLACSTLLNAFSQACVLVFSDARHAKTECHTTTLKMMDRILDLLWDTRSDVFQIVATGFPDLEGEKLENALSDIKLFMSAILLVTQTRIQIDPGLHR